MKLRNNYIMGLLLFAGINSCVAPVNCENCPDDFIRTIWSYKLRLPWGMVLSDDEIITQNSDLNKIVLLDSQTGLTNDSLPTTFGEKGKGSVVYWGVSEKIVAYEQVFDYEKSQLKIYNRSLSKITDSIQISLKKDLSTSHGMAKMFSRPVIVDSTLLFLLNDGTLYAYNFLKKQLLWHYQLNRLPISNSTIITTKSCVHVQLRVDFGSGSEITTFSKSTGKLLWKRHFPGKMQLTEFDGKLFSIAEHGNLIYIDPNNGDFDARDFINQKVNYYQLIGKKFVVLCTEDNILIIKDLFDDKMQLGYKLCAALIEVNYSKKNNSLFIVDKEQHCIQINLKENATKCIQQFVDNGYGKQNFIIRGDSLYINKNGELCLLILAKS